MQLNFRLIPVENEIFECSLQSGTSFCHFSLRVVFLVTDVLTDTIAFKL